MYSLHNSKNTLHLTLQNCKIQKKGSEKKKRTFPIQNDIQNVQNCIQPPPSENIGNAQTALCCALREMWMSLTEALDPSAVLSSQVGLADRQRCQVGCLVLGYL